MSIFKQDIFNNSSIEIDSSEFQLVDLANGMLCVSNSILNVATIGSNLSYNAGSKTLNLASNINVAGLTVGALSGILHGSNGAVTGNATSDLLVEGNNNLFFTNSRARGALSLTGSPSYFSYNNSTGVFNSLYDYNQNLLQTSSPTFNSLSLVSSSSYNGIVFNNNGYTGYCQLTSGAGSWFSGATVGDLILRTDHGHLCVGTNGAKSLKFFTNDTLRASISSSGEFVIGALNGVLKSSSGIVSGSSTTSDVPEGSNLYYTQSRFDTAFANKSTSDLTEGLNLYYTDARSRNSISLSGSPSYLSYDNSTGVFTSNYDFNQDLTTTSSPTFQKLTIEKSALPEISLVQGGNSGQLGISNGLGDWLGGSQFGDTCLRAFNTHLVLGTYAMGKNIQFSVGNNRKGEFSDTKLDIFVPLYVSESLTIDWVTLTRSTLAKLNTIDFASLDTATIRSLFSASYPLSVSSGNFTLGYNSTNLKQTANQLDTIQSIATSSSPSFENIHITKSGDTQQSLYLYNQGGHGGFGFLNDTTNNVLYFVSLDTGGNTTNFPAYLNSSGLITQGNFGTNDNSGTLYFGSSTMNKTVFDYLRVADASISTAGIRSMFSASDSMANLTYSNGVYSFQNWPTFNGIELRWVGGTPLIDFSNNTSEVQDFGCRIQYASNNLYFYNNTGIYRFDKNVDVVGEVACDSKLWIDSVSIGATALDYCNDINQQLTTTSTPTYSGLLCSSSGFTVMECKTTTTANPSLKFTSQNFVFDCYVDGTYNAMVYRDITGSRIFGYYSGDTGYYHSNVPIQWGDTVIDETDIAKIDSITNGTAAANKCLVCDANRDIGTIRNLTIDGNLVTGSTTLSESELKVLDGVTAGSVSPSKVCVVDANSDLNGIRHLTISGNLVTASGTISAAELGYIDGITPGTCSASKALVVDSNRDISNIRNIQLSGTTTASHICAGTWAPTATKRIGNATSSILAVEECRYTRIMDIVTFSGHLDMKIAAGDIVVVGLTLPIYSNFTSDYQGSGTMSHPHTDVIYLSVQANSTFDELFLYFYSISGSDKTGGYDFTGQYRIV